MKVLMVTPSFYPIIGGTETYVRNLTCALNRSGVQADILTFNMEVKWKPIWVEREEIVDGIKIIRIPAFNLFSKVSYRNPIEKLLRVNNIPDFGFIEKMYDYEIIHFHDEMDLSFPLFAFFVKKPKIFHVHSMAGTYISFEKNRLSRFIFRKIADLYVSDSDYGKSLLADLGIPMKRIRVLPILVDIKKFKPAPNKKIGNLILFVGRPDAKKGLHVLLRSLKYLETPIRLVIICPYSKSKYFEKILRMVEDLKKGSVHEVEYLSGVDNRDLPEWYQKASVFVCPSLIETFGIVNAEAISCGTPVVASKVGGIPDIIKDGITGILVPPNDPIKIAKALKKLLGDKELREKYGREGRRMIEQRFSSDCITKEITQIYEKMVLLAE